MKTWDELVFFHKVWPYFYLKLDEDNICPCIDDMFLSMELTPYEEVRCAIIGQDPYPNPSLAMGISFSIPNDVSKAISPTLRCIFNEYVNDLHLSFPTSTDLTPWARQGVFLWNAIPSCEQWKSMSHDWEEWHALTKEIVERLDDKGIVFVFIGSVARRFVPYVSSNSSTIELSHPSPRTNSYSPPSGSPVRRFKGSRMFSSINDALGYNPIDWKLE